MYILQEVCIHDDKQLWWSRDHSKLKHVVNVSGSLPGADKMNMCTGMFDDLQCCDILFLRCHLTVMFVCIQIGKAAFQRHNDPLDAALFYLAMKKKAVLWGLFRYLHYSWIELLSNLIEVFSYNLYGMLRCVVFFFLLSGLSMMRRWLSSSKTTSLRTAGERPLWKMLSPCWGSSALNNPLPSSYWLDHSKTP